MILVPWDDDSPYPHGEPMTPGRALAWGVALVIVILLIAIPGCAEFVVAVAS